MGAWTYIREPLEEVMAELGRGGDKVAYAGRKAAASPATGLLNKHIAEQQALVDEALTVPAAKPARKAPSGGGTAKGKTKTGSRAGTKSRAKTGTKSGGKPAPKSGRTSAAKA